MFPGTPHIKTTPKTGDKVAVLWGVELNERELTGWVLNITDDLIRIADNPVDDGRPDADEEWFRRAFVRAEVSVITLTSTAALAHTERHHS